MSGMQLELLTTIKKIQEKFTKQPAYDFNVFSLCGIDHYELWHSRIIAGFLSPSGSHGFKNRFLHEFADFFGMGEYSENAVVSTEVFARAEGSKFGRLDILIVDETTKNVCVIENKIFASEQLNQMSRYQTWLKYKRAQGWKSYLVFLTLNGRSATSIDADDYLTVSYYSRNVKQSIFTWLDRCAEIAKEEPAVREAACQYRDFVKRLSIGANAMNAEIIKLLQENMCAAESVHGNYQAACLVLARSILEGEVRSRLGAGWQCENGLSISRRESGVLYKPPSSPSGKDLPGRIYVIFEETNFSRCQVGLWQEAPYPIKYENFKNAGITFQAEEGWHVISGKSVDEGENAGQNKDVGEPWPVWCPILNNNTLDKCPNGIHWDGRFFDSYRANQEFREALLRELVSKIKILHELQCSIVVKTNSMEIGR